ncbi:LysO family transporter [Acetomicrobium sp.]|uniref:LysO family transporter n=1 Tax=Acetomicrobium sp. TaxID=1872099 RepID=UPI0028719977|nr:LysO family transporter [Acetomicrobium sp.]MDR9769196.1 LysO family transporter [Acetomicrobium sp.]
MNILKFISHNSMYFYIAFMLFGALVGYYEKVPMSIKRHNAKLQTLCLVVLILTIGFEIGSNGEVLLALRAIGLKAAVISLLSVLGTVLCINITIGVFSKKGMKNS